MPLRTDGRANATPLAPDGDEMKRIVDERPESPEGVLLRAASGRHVPSNARKRGLASIALATAALSATSTTAAATSTLTSAAWLKGVVGVALVVLGVGAGIAVYEGPSRPPVSVSLAPAVAVSAPPPVAPAVSVAPPVAELASTNPAAEDASPAATPSASGVGSVPLIARVEPRVEPRVDSTSSGIPAPSGPAPNASAPNAESPPAPSGLADEVGRLQTSKSSVNGGRYAEALASLAAYDAAHPRGKLRQEAEVLRVRALVGAGRKTEAAARVKAFRETYPASPHTALLEALVAP